ncbi:MAG: hypothetical protein O6938_07655 [Gammaproteobacteria bacterium]|nr:hypothetical protein [Gammaproteobacteria bacterium]
MPTAGNPISSQLEVIPEIGGGFFILASELGEKLFNHYANDELQVVFYGHFFDSATEDAARRVAQVWQTSGTEGVQRLNGLFTAVVIDKRQGQLSVISDIVGIRTCRYRCSGDGAFHLSTHNVPLMAAGGAGTGTGPRQRHVLPGLRMVDWRLQLTTRHR